MESTISILYLFLTSSLGLLIAALINAPKTTFVERFISFLIY